MRTKTINRRVALSASAMLLGALLVGCGAPAEDEAAALPGVEAEVETEAETATQEDTQPATDGSLSRATFDGTWPFGADEVMVDCLANGARIVEIEGEAYALNGAAAAAGYIELELSTPNEIWLDDPATGAKVSIGDVSRVAGDLCD